MSLGEHLEELRSRIIRCIAAVVIVFIAAWFFRERILDIIVHPHLVATRSYHIETALKFRSYLEPITAQLKASIIVALIIAAPWLLYQMWGFIVPGLYQHERSALVRIGLVSMLCFSVGVAFGYFLFIPTALKFLLSLSGPTTQPVLMIGDYLSLFFIMTFALGAAFQTPLVMYQLVKWDIVSIEVIQKHRKGAILTAFILAAILTPPDPMTQIMMALPLIAFYDLGALAASPSRAALWDFSKFAGAIGLVVALGLGYYYYSPVGQIRATEGRLELGRHIVEGAGRRSLYRSQQCTLPEDSRAQLTFDAETEILIGGPAQLRVSGSRTISVVNGKIFIRNEDGLEVEVHTPLGRVIVSPGTTQLTFSKDDGLSVQVLRGQAEVQRRGNTSIIPAGRTATF
ncbi:MAG: twin-arginine translocase subunit TatC, partial [Planctomycetota bacterium]